MIDLQTVKDEMAKRISVLETGLAQIRTSGATPALVANVEVDYYGMATPINQVAQISVVEGKQLVIKPFEARMTKDIEKAIHAANIGFNPQNEGNQIRIIVPALTTEKRKEYAKQTKTMSDEAKVAVRNIRRDANDKIKKDKSIPEDESKDLLDKIQKATDETIAKIEKIQEKKEKEIMTL